MNDTSTTFDLLDDPATIVADRQAVQEFAEKGTPIDPTVLHRVRARANRVRENTRTLWDRQHRRTSASLNLR